MELPAVSFELFPDTRLIQCEICLESSYLRSLRLPSQLAQFLTQHLLLLSRDILVPEEHYTALRDGDGQIADFGIILEYFKEVRLREFATDDVGDVEGLVLVKRTAGFQGLGEGVVRCCGLHFVSRLDMGLGGKFLECGGFFLC